MQNEAALAQVEQERKVRWFSRPTAWFWTALTLGAVLRLYLVVFTQGTTDVDLWEENARGVHQLGLVGYYHAEPTANHPPFIFEIESLSYGAATGTGIPFRVLLRGPFAVIDLGTTLLLMTLIQTNRYRFLVAACYWINPLAIIFSAYHGNTDCGVAFLLLLCVWCLARGKLLPAAIAAGAGLWIKLSAVLVLPSLLLFLPKSRARILFFLGFGVTSAVGYLPAIIQDPHVLYTNVLAYRGLALQTVAGIPVWGPRVLLSVLHLPAKSAGVDLLLRNSWQVAIALMLLLMWARRLRRTLPELCATVAGVYVVIYAFTDNWSFQYFAWALPFWFFLGPIFFVPAILLAGGYIYSLYWLLCGNPWLLGTWNFEGHPYWPLVVVTFRNLAVIFFFVSACVLLFLAVRQSAKRLLLK